MVRIALRTAQASNGDQFRHSALIVGKGGRVIVAACNLVRKTHPEGSGCFQAAHAEVRAIAKARAMLNRQDLSGLRIICCRINRQGKIMLSKPCKDCAVRVADAGLRVSYSTNAGDFVNG